MTESIETSESTAEQQPLGALVGVWKAEWQTEETESEPAVRIIGTNTYEWLRGNFSLIHYVNSPMGNYDYKATEIIGYDAPTKTYRTYTFDNQGVSLAYELRFEGNASIFKGESQRTTLVIGQDGNTMTTQWERLEADNEWHPWINMRFTRTE